MAPQEKLTILVKGFSWEIKLFLPSDFIEEVGEEDCAGITYKGDRQILFRADHLDVGTIRHEILHAYFAECNIESATLDQLATEEIACSIIGEFGEQIVKQARELRRSLIAAKKRAEHDAKNAKHNKKTKNKPAKKKHKH